MRRVLVAMLAALSMGATSARQQPRITMLADLGARSEEGWVAPSPSGLLFVAVDSTAYVWVRESRALREVARGIFWRPVWSPDGNQIAFDRDVGDTTCVFVVRINARTGALRGEPSRIAAGYSPKFSPDGTRIAFARDATGGRELVVVMGNGSRPAAIARSRDRLAPIGWSADGHWVYYAALDPRARSWPILRVAAAGGEPQPVLARNLMRAASVSPDGRYLLISPAPESLAVVDSTGRTVAAVAVDDAGTGLSSGAPAWDGTNIVYATLRRTRSLVAVSVDDGARRVLSETGTRSVFPDVSPDGRFVATLTNDGRGTFVRITNLQNGTSRRFATRAATNEGEIRWSPDGAWVAVLTGNTEVGGLHPEANGLDIIEVATGRVEQPPVRAGLIRAKWRADSRALRYMFFQPPDSTGTRRVEVRETRIGGPDSLVRAFHDHGGAIFADYDHAYSIDRGLFYDLRTGASRRLIDSSLIPRPSGPGLPRLRPVFSPDGRWLAAPARMAAGGGNDRLMLVSAADATSRYLDIGPVTFSSGGGLYWFDSGTIVATARDADGVWRRRLVPVDGGPERRIGPTDPQRVSIYFGVDSLGRRILVSSPDSLGPAALMRIEPWQR